MAISINIPISILIAIVAVLGFLVGGFFNRLVQRMPFDISLRKKETCPHCETPVSLFLQIPIFGYLFTRFRYPCCKNKRFILGFLVEVFTILGAFSALGVWFIFYSKGDALTLDNLFPFLILEWLILSLVPVFIIDYKYHLLPDTISIGGIVVGIILSFLPGWITPWESILGALLAGGGLFLFAKLIAKIVGSQAMGFGDVKLLAGYGAMMGVSLAVEILILASVIGVCVVFPARMIFAKAFKTENETTPGEFPFGPFLALAAPIIFLYGDQVLALYLSMFEV